MLSSLACALKSIDAMEFRVSIFGMISISKKIMINERSYLINRRIS